MGRKRKSNPLDLPERVRWHHGAFWYRHRNGPDERLGTDVEKAKERGRLLNDPQHEYGTMAYFLDQFIVDSEKRVKSGALSERTVSDYKINLPPLKAFFGKLAPVQVAPSAVQEYIDLGQELNRAVRANRERACLSACLSWMIRTGAGDITVNPCMRASGIKRNKETKRDRYVEDAEFKAVYDRAPKMVRIMMMLQYRTLQRPEDIIGWGPWNIKAKDGSKVLRVKQGKRGAMVDIALAPEIEDVLKMSVVSITQPFIHTLKGVPYTYDGLSSMFRRVQKKVRKDVPALAKMLPWGFYDLKGKGATDMWRAGVPIELIQQLCGHADSKTTEIYIKARWRETSAPNVSKMEA